jgi:hypothetical protein
MPALQSLNQERMRELSVLRADLRSCRSSFFLEQEFIGSRCGITVLQPQLGRKDALTGYRSYSLCDTLVYCQGETGKCPPH